MKKTLFSMMAVLAIAMFAATQPALAQKTLFANVSADAQCTVTGTDVLVDAGLIQKDAPSPGPIVSTVVFFLEQHFPNQNDWNAVAGTEVTQAVNKEYLLELAGQRYDVALQDYPSACTQVSPTANAVRAVVKITVDNANTKRPGENVFTGRCISFPNPCR